MKRPLLSYLFALFFLLSGSNLLAKKKIKYPISDIPDILIENADAVVRDKSVNIEIISPKKIIATEKYAITILKKSGSSKGNYLQYYSKMSHIKDIKISTYNSIGMLLDKTKNYEIIDISAIPNYTLYSDYRVKYINPTRTSFPYTIEYYCEKEYSSALYLSSWYASEGYNTSVQSNSLSVTVPNDYNFRYKELNMPETATTEELGNKTRYNWRVNNLKAYSKEPLSPPLEYYVPTVMMAPSNFSFKGFEGDLSTWNEFGKFCLALNEGRDNIPDETIEHIKTLISDDMTDYEKISVIYKYSQDKNRYVNIAIGIGGLQPFDAETVDKLSYGDCKGLSNYVVSILKRFGYNAYYTLVEAGDKGYFDRSFPHDPFNHIIVSVPLEQDTIWLECTNPYVPCGYIGDFTDNREVLMITPEGGKLVRTPTYSSNNNYKNTKATVLLQTDGSATTQLEMRYAGVQFGEQNSLINMDVTDRRKKLISSLSIPQSELVDYSLAVNKGRIPQLIKQEEIFSKNYSTSIGKRLIIPINALNRIESIPRYSRNRKTPFHIERNYHETDTILIEIPKGTQIESFPESQTIKSDFGYYSCELSIQDNKVTYIRNYELKECQFPGDMYNKFIAFLERAAIEDNKRIILLVE